MFESKFDPKKMYISYLNYFIMLHQKIDLIKGDITKINVDCIVNAANNSLLGGGGVDGAIHRAAGPDLYKECKTLGGCPTGYARVTKGYNLPAKYIIHTVGPVWRGGKNREVELLADCYKNSLQLAAENNIKTLAFPAISTGVYSFPKEAACDIAVNEVIQFLRSDLQINKVVFVVFDEENYEIYKKKLH
jgi:O-acetyl-ADP-ribose deacetylase